MTRKNVLVFRELPEDQLARLRQVHQVTVADPRMLPDEFNAALPTTHGLIGASHPVDAALLDRAPQLEVISSVSVGVDNYPLAELYARGIVLCHTPGVLTETVADTAFALLMATQRRVVELANLVRDGQWKSSVGDDLFGYDVHGKTLGIVGFGRIAPRGRPCYASAGTSRSRDPYATRCAARAIGHRARDAAFVGCDARDDRCRVLRTHETGRRLHQRRARRNGR